jgi:hypothetical protein
MDRIPGQDQLELGFGRALRDEGAGLRIEHNPSFHDHAMGIIGYLAGTGREFTSDDLRSRLRWLPDHPNSIGAAFLAASKTGLIERAGSRSTKTIQGHARRVGVWRGVPPGTETKGTE